MAAKEPEEGGGAGGDYLSTFTFRAIRGNRRPNRTMNRIQQKMNGGKEEKTGRIQIRRIRSRQIGRFYTMNCPTLSWTR